MNTVLLNEIEQRVVCLSPQEQLFLIERLASLLRNTALPDAEQLQRELEQMANDPEIQREIKSINEEFACTEMDGLE